MSKECIFCKIAKGEIPSEKIYENDSFFSIYDVNPLTKGHALVISKKHFETILDLPNTAGVELVECIKETALSLMKKFNVTGFNVANNNFSSANQEVMHIHFHIIPRKEGDGIKWLSN